MNDKEEIVKIHEPEKYPGLVVDFKNDCIWVGKKKALCSRDLAKSCTLLCPLVSVDRDGDNVSFFCGCQEVCYEIDEVVE